MVGPLGDHLFEQVMARHFLAQPDSLAGEAFIESLAFEIFLDLGISLLRPGPDVLELKVFDLERGIALGRMLIDLSEIQSLGGPFDQQLSLFLRELHRLCRRFGIFSFCSRSLAHKTKKASLSIFLDELAYEKHEALNRTMARAEIFKTEV
jgi:hypothetical protein